MAHAQQKHRHATSSHGSPPTAPGQTLRGGGASGVARGSPAGAAQSPSHASPLAAPGGSPVVSKKLMAMKFMQRGQESALRAELEQEHQKVVDDSHWVLPLPEGLGIQDGAEPQVEVLPSMLQVMETALARQSYQSFNKEIEKQANEARRQAQLARAAQVESRDSVSDQDMVKRFQALRGNHLSGRGRDRPSGKRKADEALDVESQRSQDRQTVTHAAGAGRPAGAGGAGNAVRRDKALSEKLHAVKRFLDQ